MGNRYAYNEQSLDKQVRKLYVILLMTSGAPVLQTSNNSGVASVTDDGTGEFTVNFSDQWTALLGFNGAVVSDTAQDITFQVKENNINNTNKNLIINTLEAGVAADVLDDSYILLEVTVKNSSVK